MDKKEKKQDTKDKKITEEEKIAKAMEELVAENADLKDKLLRAISETENLRKRTAKEITDMATYSVSKFAKEMLAVSDNLKRALSAISEEERQKDESLNNLFTGVNVTENQLMKTFEKFDIKKVECEGTFDPNIHEVMMEQESENEAGTIIMVLEEGFTIGDRLLRPARVIVSK
jgi:molecular chaperone GrpE